MATRTILLDIGGTYIKCSDGRTVGTNAFGSRDEITQALREAVGPLDGLTGIGVAVPGPFNYTNGTFLMTHKFGSVHGERFPDLVLPPDCPESPVFRYAHDVAIMLEGAIRMLDLKYTNTALVTLGTGLGFCHSINGIVQYNQSGSPAFSLWNQPAPGGGILEDKVSARGISAEYGRKTGRNGLSPKQIANLAHSGDILAADTFSAVGETLGENIQEILNRMGIKTLLMGGQISSSLDLMLAPLQEELPDVCIKKVPGEAVFHGLSTLFETN